DGQMRERLVAEPVRHARRGRLFLQALAERRVAEHAAIRRLVVAGENGRAPGEERLERVGMAQRELHAEREAADLRPQLAAAPTGALDVPHLAEHARGSR